MAWPIILSLIGSAAEMSAEDTEKKRAAEALEKQALLDTQRENEMREALREKERMAAMARAIDAGYQPLPVEKEVPREEVDYDPTRYQTLAGLGKLAQQLGGYYETSPTSNTGAQTYYSDPITDIDVSGRYARAAKQAR